MLRNEIANLAQNVKPGPCWFDFFVFHACRVAGSNRQANTFFNFLRDGCDFSLQIRPVLKTGLIVFGTMTRLAKLF